MLSAIVLAGTTPNVNADETASNTTATPELPLACTATTAVPGDTVSCQILTTDSFTNATTVTVTTDGGQQIPTTRSRSGDSYWATITMPPGQITITARATTAGQGTGTSCSLTLTPDENANLQLSCVPVHPSVGGSVTCTARSRTGAGALLIFQQGDWRTTIRTVRNWTHHTIDVPVTTDASARETDITVTLINRSREAIDSETLKLSMTGSLLGAELDTSSPPPQMYAFPAVIDQPCPDGWGRSWQAWASADVCELFTYFNTTTGQYDVTFDEAQAIIKRYTARTQEAEAPSEEGSLVQLKNRKWTVLDTQKVFFSNSSDTGFDRRDREILERVIAVESTYPGAIVAVSGYADTITVRDERIDAVNNVLTSRGVPAPDVTITPGDPSASPDMERVDFAILAPADVPTVTLDPTSGPLAG